MTVCIPGNMVELQKVVRIVIIILINTVKPKTPVEDVEKKTAEEPKLMEPTTVKETTAVRISREEIAPKYKVTNFHEFSKFQLIDKHIINYK